MEISYDCKYVVFLDILGFKNKVNQYSPDVVEWILNTTKDELHNQETLRKGEITDFEKKVVMFSDSIYMAYSVDEYVSLVHDLMELLQTAAQNGYYYRGGIVCGDVFDKERDIIFGPAINKAYEIESKVSFYPRIVIDKEIMKINSYFKEKGIVLVKQDFDGEYFVDFLRPCNCPLTYFRIIADNLEAEYQEVKKLQDENAIQKIEWLVNYFNNNLQGDVTKIEIDSCKI